MLATTGAIAYGWREIRTAGALAVTQAIAREESVESVSQDLRDLEGMTPELVAKLADGGVHTRDELADLATDELTDLTGQTPEEATAMIMLARAHWFNSDETPASN